LVSNIYTGDARVSSSFEITSVDGTINRRMSSTISNFFTSDPTDDVTYDMFVGRG